MARKRMIDPTIWEDPGFNKLSSNARLLFIGMISNADDEGRIRADAGALRRLVFGFDDDITRENVDSFIVELRRISSLHFYEIDDERHAHFTNWTKFQKLQSDRIAPSLLPPCPDCSASIKTVQDCIVDEDGSKTSIPIRIRIAQRDKMCMYCGIKFPTKSVRFVLEHMVPVSQGGKTTDDNCVLACWSCNTKKGGRTPEQAGMELIQDGSILDPNVSVGKVSIGKSRLEQNSAGKESAERKTNYPSQSSGSVADAQEKPRGVPEVARLRDALHKKNPPKLGILLLLFGLLLLAKPTYAADKIVVRYTITSTNGHKSKPPAKNVAGGASGRTGASTSPSPTRTASQQTVPPSASHGLSGRGEVLAGAEPYTAIVLPEQEETAAMVRSVYVEEPEKAIAVFRAESGLRPDAKGWNCHYYRDDGSQYSAACAVEDRKNAWSVDCGLTQMNVAGKECPAEYLDPQWNLEKSYEWKYLPRKWQPWVAERLGRHLQFLSFKKS